MVESPSEQLSLSVQERSEAAFRVESPITFYLASLGDNTPAWPSRARDMYLDKFWRTEPTLAGAVSSMCAKISALDFKLTGPSKAVTRARNLLLNADFGLGWVGFAAKVSQDILCSDNGGFIELLRPRGAGANSPVVGLAHLDSQRIERTGDPDWPVLYTDNKGAVHRLAWYQVVSLTDLPSPREEHKGYGFCPVSRVLSAAQLLRDVGLYKRQKLGGKSTVPAIIFVQGMRRNAVKEALDEALQEQLSDEGLTRFSRPVILASPDPGQPLEAKLIELAGLPDNFDEDQVMKWYITSLALAFGTDYAEFAPLPAGNLGSGSQATEMAARSRGKGPGVLIQLFEYALNWYVLPQSTEFQFAATDAMAERERIEMSLQRARERAMRINAGELTPQQALRLAVDAGDAPASFLEEPVEEVPEGERIEDIVRGYNDLYTSYARMEKLLCQSQKPHHS